MAATVSEPMAAMSPFRATAEDYAHNLLVRSPLRRLSPALVRRLEGVELLASLARASAPKRKKGAAELDAKSLRAALLRHARDRSEPIAPRSPEAPLPANLDVLSALLGLDDVERALLQFALALHENTEFQTLFAALGDVTLVGAASLFAAAIGAPIDRLLAAFSRTRPLLGSGLLEWDDFANDLPRRLTLKAGLLDAALEPGLSRASLLARFLPEARAGSLCWEDVAHVPEARVAKDILGAALAERRAGVNLLLYGDTGTGKTSLAQLLARDLTARLYATGREDERGRPPDVRDRLSSLQLGQRLVGEGALLLFDELEDLFTWDTAPVGTRRRATAQLSKQWFNHQLETNPVPTVWISNEVRGIDPAFLRRFTFALEVRPAGIRQRARILQRHLGPDAALSAADVDALAHRYVASPAQLSTAVATARLIEAGAPTRRALEALLAPMQKLITGVDPSRAPVFDPAAYALRAVHASEDLAVLADRLSTWGHARDGRPRGALSLCLYGPPGTGKSEYVRYLAHRMAKPVLAKRASDILGPWIGETEGNIAQAFREAEESDAVLLFDEVDSLLRSRATAVRSWEVSQVNEFLQQLEAFQGVVVCTTNLWRELDEASLRRFVFKVEFKYAPADQALALFESTLAGALAAPLSASDRAAVHAALGALSNLTPGDFAAVARRFSALGEPADCQALLVALTAEVKAKPNATGVVGFRR